MLVLWAGKSRTICAEACMQGGGLIGAKTPLGGPFPAPQGSSRNAQEGPIPNSSKRCFALTLKSVGR